MKAVDFSPWPQAKNSQIYEGSRPQGRPRPEQVQTYLANCQWEMPAAPTYFFCDLHADQKAFELSLHKAGLLRPDGRTLNDRGLRAKIIIGGDLFDKGPAHLPLLDFLCHLKKQGAHLDLVAGNHDIRTFIGIHYMEATGQKTGHLFSRMGGKTMTLFREVFDRFGPAGLPECPFDEGQLEKILFPSSDWLEQFPHWAQAYIHREKLEKERKRLPEKIDEVKKKCIKFNLSLQQLYSTVLKTRELFFSDEGPYHWIFPQMNLALQRGSFLFVHGGVDDAIVPHLLEKDEEKLRQWFHQQLTNNVFDLYHGPVGNCFRTKYRPYDGQLSAQGIEQLHQGGVHALVHGHLNLTQGQRLVLRQGMLNIECDCSLDKNTRLKEHLSGQGWAYTEFLPEGICRGASGDYPGIKELHFPQQKTP